MTFSGTPKHDFRGIWGDFYPPIRPPFSDKVTRQEANGCKEKGWQAGHGKGEKGTTLIAARSYSARKMNGSDARWITGSGFRVWLLGTGI